MKIGKIEKLVLNLKDKQTYAVRIKNLHRALKHDQKLRKVHQVIRFEQINWMKTCIVLNTKLRMAANNEFKKDLFKVMNNSVFGKTLENIRNYKEASGKPKKICQVVMKPNFQEGYSR